MARKEGPEDNFGIHAGNQPEPSKIRKLLGRAWEWSRDSLTTSEADKPASKNIPPAPKLSQETPKEQPKVEKKSSPSPAKKTKTYNVFTEEQLRMLRDPKLLNPEKPKVKSPGIIKGLRETASQVRQAKKLRQEREKRMKGNSI